MSDLTPVTPTFINSSMTWMTGWEMREISGTLAVASSAWPTANTAIFLPLSLPWPYQVRRLFWVNGSTAGGNWSIGLYTNGGAQIYGSTAQAGSGATTPQYVTPATPILLDPGFYYIGLTHDAVTANHAYAYPVTANAGRGYGIYQMASAHPLSGVTQATFAQWASLIIPVCGITRTASGF